MIKEEVLNTEIGNILRSCLHNADIKIEESGQLKKSSRTPDLTVSRDSRQPILIEHKIDNETELTKQCQERFNEKWENGTPVRLVIGLSSSTKIKTLQNTARLKQVLSDNNEFRWVLWQDSIRFPAKGWLQGNLQTFAGFLDRTGADAIDITDAIDRIKIAFKNETEALGRNQFSHGLFAQILKQEVSDQTTRMGLAIILNAIIFQAHISNNHTEINSPAQMLSDNNVNQVSIGLLWRQILEINYIPIFQLARQLLVCIKHQLLADNMIRHLFIIAQEVSQEVGSQGLIGLIFGELIKDRKLLASFYTMSYPALLFSEMTVSKLDTDWSDIKQIQNLRIADFAVGTGTLLVTAYKRIAERYMLHGYNPNQLHQIIMEQIMIGCDVDPSAIHITAARLSGEYPDIDYKRTKIYAMPYGLTQTNGATEYKLGSLDLLTENKTPTLFGDGTKLVMPLPKPELPRVDTNNLIDIKNNSLDVIIMNPPFTRSTGHEAAKKGISNPAFAGLGNDQKAQRQMSKVLKSHLSNIKKQQSILASHGNAGLGSNFMDLAHTKLKPGGVLALILPITVISGNAWSNLRQLLAKYYQDIVFISLSAHGKYGRNWSSDTSLSEVMLIAKKNKTEADGNQFARYVMLDQQPQTANEAIAIAQSINQQIKDGDIKIGNNRFGWMITDNLNNKLGNPSGIKNSDLAILGKNLPTSVLILPQSSPVKLPLSNLQEFGYVGAYHADISGFNADQTARGAFDIDQLEDRNAYDHISYPALWSHETELERNMIVTPDSEGRVRYKMRHQAVRTWQGYQGSARLVGGASQLHINRDFSTISQSLGACLTPVETLGGRAWPSLQIKDKISDKESVEKVICLWLNTSLGLIGRWYISNRQQPGRSMLSIQTIGSIPIIDIKQLSQLQIQQLAKVFDKYSKTSLQSAYLADKDTVRQSIDRQVFSLLNLPTKALKALSILRKQWCSESSVRGDKQ